MNLQSDAIMDVLHTYEKEDLFEFQLLLNKHQNELNTHISKLLHQQF